MNRIKLDLTQEQVSAWGTPVNEEEVQNRFPELWNKYGEDPGFFFTVYSEAATDWVNKKSSGGNVKALSGHFSQYLRKRAKKAATPEKTDTPDEVPFPVEEEDLLSVASSSDSDNFMDTENGFESYVSEPLDLPSVSDEPPLVAEAVPSSPVKEQNEQADAGSRLYLLDEDEEPEYEPDESADLVEQEGFGRHKRKRSALMTGFIVMFGLLLVAGIGMTALAKMFDEEPVKEEKPIEDFSSLHRGRVSNISQEMNKGERTELKEQEVKTHDPKPQQAKPVNAENRPRPTGGGGYRANEKKDEEILAKYAEAVDPAAGHGVVAGNPRAQRRHFTPGSTEGSRGGVFISGDREEKTERRLNIHNTQIRVRLEYSIRSTASTTVVAIVTDDSGKIPQGAKFYGNASGHANKRTQINFNRLVIDGTEYSVKGFAIQGRDPGIESEVTDISKENIDTAVRSGITQTASNIATHYAGAVGQQTGNAAQNTIDPAAAEVQRQQEANRLTQEYRVPAGTSFFIYLE